MKSRTLVIRLTLFFAALIALNIASYHFFFRLDFTSDKSFTLSGATKSLLKELPENVAISAYFSEDLPTQLAKSRKDFEDLLVEYKNRSAGKVSFSFVNPNENEGSETLAQTEGIRPVMVNVSERDQVKQLRAYMGAVVNASGKKETLPMIHPGESAEYALTTAVKKLVEKEKTKVAFLQGHGERHSTELAQVVEQLSIAYTVENFTLTDTTEISPAFKALLIIDPTDSIPPLHFSKIEDYMSKGGTIFIAYSNLFGDLRSKVLQKIPDNGMQTWLNKFGISVENYFIIDVQCRTVAIQQQQGPFVYNKPVKFPFFPVIKEFEEHPVTKGLDAVFFPFVSAMTIQKVRTDLTVTPLAYSSSRSGRISPPVVMDFDKEWAQSDFAKGRQLLAVAVEGPLNGISNSKMIVICNGKFAINTEPGQEELNADNVNLVSNSVDWLSDDTGLIELRTKAITYRPLDQVEDSTKEIVKYANVLLPVIIIVVVGFLRRVRGLRKRRRLMQVTF